jgi:hypothetical protein
VEAHPPQEQSTPAASSKVEIVVHDVIDNGATGRIELLVKSRHKAEDGSLQEGPVKVYGIDADALRLIHNNSLDSFLQWIKREHSGLSVIGTSMRKQLSALKGKTL